MELTKLKLVAVVAALLIAGKTQRFRVYSKDSISSTAAISVKVANVIGMRRPAEPSSSGLRLARGAGQPTVAVAQPTLPKATVDLTMPVQRGTVRRIPAGDSRAFQAALKASTCGDTIILQAGSTYSGTFMIPDIGSCTGWVIIESSNSAELPAGVRVGPASVPNMATLTSALLVPVLQFKAEGIHDFRFIGLEISCATGVCDAPKDLTNGLVEIDGGLPSSVSATPNDIIIDRCYIHGSPTQNIRSGIRANGTNIAVVDSYINEIHESGAATGGDSQDIEGWNGAGPILIQNNFLEAASENVMFGGASTQVPGLIPSDITILGNYFSKDLSWRGKAAPYNWVIKDDLEIKNAQRVLVQGNVFENNWEAGQAGELIEFTPRSLGSDGHETAADITFTDNLLQHAALGFIIAPSDNNHTPTSQPSQRILIQNNVLTDINSSWGSSRAWALLIEDIPGDANSNNRTDWHDLTIDHNDFLVENQTGCGAFVSGGHGPSAVPAGPVQFTNNIMVGDICGQGRFPGKRTIDFYWRDVSWDKNLLVGSRAADYSKETLLRSNIKALGFAKDLSGAEPDAYQLPPSSRYHNAGTDGKDIGVYDWSTWNAVTFHAVRGDLHGALGDHSEP